MTTTVAPKRKTTRKKAAAKSRPKTHEEREVQRRRTLSISEIAALHDIQQTLLVRVEGDFLLPHQFGKKAREIMIAQQRGEASAKVRAPKVPVVDAVEALYFVDGQPAIPKALRELTSSELGEPVHLEFVERHQLGFPATAIKQAIVRAGKGLGLTMTDLRSSIYVPPTEGCGGLIALECEEAWMRGDYARVGKGTADIRFRTELRNWSAEFYVDYVPSVCGYEQVLQCVASAGRYVGICDWRPEKDGVHGTWRMTHVEVPE